MKKRGLVISLLSICLVLFLISSVFAATCVMTAQLINQDPYPATPGDYVKLVFQVNGISNPECGNVNFELKNKFPISFDPGASSSYSAVAGGYKLDYGSFLTIPFKVRVSEDAVDGDNQIETLLSYQGVPGTWNNFSLSIQDLRSNFDVYLKNYDILTNTATLEVLNIGKTDIKALTMTILPDSAVSVKGPSKNVLGDLDSNEYTTADFELAGKGKLNFRLEYTDGANVRRNLDKTMTFDASAFEGRKKDEKKTPVLTYVISLVVIVLIGYWAIKKFRKKK
jgi:uncharacterized protein YneF (UPF0154 family)